MVTRDYPPKASGIARHTSELVRALAGLGVAVDVISGHGDIGTLLIPWLKDLLSYDIVHVQSTPYAALVKNQHLVLTAHSPVATEFRFYPLAAGMKAPFAYLCERISLRKAKQVIAVSHGTKDDLIRRYGVAEDMITLIPNAVDAERFRPSRKLDSEHPRVLMCSRLEPRKNITEALLALARLKDRSIQCDIIGVGSQGKALTQIARRLDVNVRFLGLVPEEELQRHYAAAGIFLSTSASEGFGLTVLEAMASGCAVIVSDIMAHKEFVHHFKNGLVYRTTDELISHLRLLIDSPDLAEQIGAEARKTALQYSWTRAAEKVLEAYQKVLSDPLDAS
jgi:glycosyltransferase involved in cell wall biosynthesis